MNLIKDLLSKGYVAKCSYKQGKFVAEVEAPNGDVSRQEGNTLIAALNKAVASFFPGGSLHDAS